MTDPSALFDLSGKVALVTGASSGLGVTFAEALADAGADLVLAARRVDRLDQVAARIEERGRLALPVACDITDAAQVEAAIERGVGEFGHIDILVANAGAGPRGLRDAREGAHGALRGVGPDQPDRAPGTPARPPGGTCSRAGRARSS